MARETACCELQLRTIAPKTLEKADLAAEIVANRHQMPRRPELKAENSLLQRSTIPAFPTGTARMLLRQFGGGSLRPSNVELNSRCVSARLRGMQSASSLKALAKMGWSASPKLPIE